MSRPSRLQITYQRNYAWACMVTYISVTVIALLMTLIGARQQGGGVARRIPVGSSNALKILWQSNGTYIKVTPHPPLFRAYKVREIVLTGILGPAFRIIPDQFFSPSEGSAKRVDHETAANEPVPLKIVPINALFRPDNTEITPELLEDVFGPGSLSHAAWPGLIDLPFQKPSVRVPPLAIFEPIDFTLIHSQDTGRLVVDLVIDRRGLKEWRIVDEQPLGMGLGDAYVEMLLRSAFVPARENGKAVTTSVRLYVTVCYDCASQVVVRRGDMRAEYR